METVRWASPHLLWLIAALGAALVWRALAARPRCAGAVGRTLLTGLAAAVLVAALAGPSVRVSRQGASPVVILQDVSPSLAPRGSAEQAGPLLSAYTAALPSRYAGLVQMSGEAAAVVAPMSAASAGLTHPDGFAPSASLAGQPVTDIARGLETAALSLPGGSGIVLLYSDALETRGDGLAAATRLAARGFRVYAVAPALAPRDVGIVSLSAPAQTPVGRPFAIEVRMAATVPAAATVTLVRTLPDSPETAPVRLTQQASAGPGSPVTVRFQDALAAPARAEYAAQVASDADDWPQNDRAACTVQVGDKARLVYVYGGDRPGRVLEYFAAGYGRNTTVLAVPIAHLRMQDTTQATVILDNVSAWALGKDRAEPLARQVSDGALGLLVLGGDASFAAGGYGDSPLEDLLPVSSRTGKRPPLDLVFVIDASGSMNEAVGEVRKLTLAKQAVLALRPALAEGDRVGVVAFAGEPRVHCSPVPAAQWDVLAQRLREIDAGGGTRITPAVTLALGLFGPRAADDRTARRIILVSDGHSDDFDVEPLVAACRAAGASASAVATGKDADRERLGQLAAGTEGRLYGSVDLGRLVETFLKDMALARGEAVLPGPRPAAWVRPEPVWTSAGPALPPVPEIDPTEAKPGADVLWSSPDPVAGRKAAPLLATWQKGLGRVAVMPWSVGSAGDKWDADDKLGNYVRSVLKWLDTKAVPTAWSARLVARGNDWWVRVEERPEAITESAAPFEMLVSDDGAAGPTAIPQIAPGLYEVRLGARGEGHGMPVIIHRRDESGSSAALPVPALAPLEFERFGVDLDRLAAMARAGGGAVLSSPQTLAEIVAQTESRNYVPVGVFLAGLAAVLVLLQAGLRLAGRL
jgi:Ca-activated chloride channel homolog